MPGGRASPPAAAAPAAVERVEMAIVGGGLCGVLAARNCATRGLSYRVVEREARLGGNWHTLANAYSHLQAFEPNYRWDDAYRLNADPLTKNSAGDVLSTLDRFAADHGVDKRVWFRTECVTVTRVGPAGEAAAAAAAAKGQHRFRVVCRDLATGRERVLLANFLCVTCGILGEQWTAEERGVADVGRFRGVVTNAGRHRGQDCALGGADLRGKRVVILGSGSFAAEAIEAAERAGAEHVTVVGRPRHRWILPFSRQYTITAMANAPLIPWALKSRLALAYVRRRFYEPCGLAHWAPTGGPADMDYSGQCSDGYFRLAAAGRLRCVVGKVERLARDDVVLASGEALRADVLVVAAGCRFNLDPPFLKDLGVGEFRFEISIYFYHFIHL